ACDVEPFALEVDARLGGVADGDVGGVRDDRIAQRDFGVAFWQIFRIAVADAPGPVFDLLGVAFAWWAGFEGQFADGRGGAAAFGRIQHRAAVLGFADGDVRFGVPFLVEHYVLFFEQHKRAFGAHYTFAVV